MPADVVVFDEVRFPEEIDFGVTGGPEFSTTVLVTAGGFEQRNENWEEVRHSWTVGNDLKDDTEFATLLDFFMARRGRLRGFRFKDHQDFEAAAQVCRVKGPLGGAEVGDGVETEFQLQKKYTSGGQTTTRTIRKPVAADPAPQVFLDTGGGPVLQTEGVDYTIDTTTGIVTFTIAPAVGDVVTWTGEFDVPVRFDADKFDAELPLFGRHNWDGLPIVEIRIPEDS